MHWIVPTDKETATATLGKHLWDAAEPAGPATYSGRKSGRDSAPAFIERIDETAFYAPH
jgi:hypothetical protein